MLVSIAIMSCGRWKLLRNCLLSLQQTSAEKIIVTTQEVIPTDILMLLNPKDQIFLQQPSNISHNRNLALNSCHTNLIYFLDEDCEWKPNQNVEILVQLFQNQPGLVASGGYYASTDQISFLGKMYNHMTNLWLDCLGGQCFVGGNMMLHLGRLPPGIRFDERLFFGGEETDFFYRLKLTATEGLLSEILTVGHSPQHSLCSLWHRAQVQSRGPSFLNFNFSLSGVWKRSVQRPFLSLGVVAYTCLVWIFRLSRHKSKAVQQQ